jgi:CRISPR-associated endonuclease/helicase Cas3
LNEPPKPPCGLPFWVAHTPSKQNPRFHSLKKHIFSVSEMARSFAEPLHAGEIAYFLGLLHDLGKFREEFQRYLHECYQAAKNNTTPPQPGSAPHKQAGALAAELMIATEWGNLLALPLYGHHGGMKSLAETPRVVREKTSRDEVEALLALAQMVDSRLYPSIPDLTLLESLAKEPETLEMTIRLIYSCLVDADSLDTEAHNDPDAAQRRAQASPPSLLQLRDLLMERQEIDFEGKSGLVNEVRRDVYDTCVAIAQNVPGFFTLTVPTGGGKTRSSLAFALCHAVQHGLRRVVYAIPYTSIVDQTATVFRSLFGDAAGTILEHHSAIDIRRRVAKEGETGNTKLAEIERWRRLAAQNWDAPLIVTTTVQLFESLFSNRPSACRKLHRLAGSVIVLDEAQCLPTHLMAPIRSGLKTLVEQFGATVVFCTATQPAHDVQTPHLAGLSPRPIIAKERQQQHFSALKRVRYFIKQETWDWPRVAKEIQQDKTLSCLCVVNTRRQALDLLDILDKDGENPEVFHLSTLLCGRHRQDVLAEITSRLKNNERTLLVSTTVIEAGVDLDFPRALRAMGPLERIVQAAGRCNREGLRPRDESHVTVFTPEDGASPRGVYRMALSRTVNLLGSQEEAELDDPIFVTNYFRRLYADLAIDPKEIGKRVQDDRAYYRYDEVAQKVRLIEEETIGVFVSDYSPDEARAVLDEARRIGHMHRDLWQRAQPFCVSLPARDVTGGKLPIVTDPSLPDLPLWQGKYDGKRGIPLDKDLADVVYDPAVLITTN